MMFFIFNALKGKPIKETTIVVMQVSKYNLQTNIGLQMGRQDIIINDIVHLYI